MGRRSVSIQDIARIAGVSHSTVSRALHNSTLISTNVRKHIQQLAIEMGYTPNAIAQSLQMRRSNTVGLVVTSIGDPFWSDVVRGVEEIARNNQISVFLSSAYTDPEQEFAAIEQFHRRRVDGILVADAHMSKAHADRIMRMRVPTVLINCQVDGMADWSHSVAVDDALGARLAVEHLVQLGHRAIGYLGITNRPLSNRRRLSAYREVMREAGLGPPPEWEAIATEPMLEDSIIGELLAPRLLEAGVTALFCYNDMLAIGALLACREHNVIVPDQMSVIGFDDIPASRFVTPSLTTIHQPKHSLGTQAMSILLDLLADRPAQNVVVVPTLIERQSTQPALHRSASSE